MAEKKKELPMKGAEPMSLEKVGKILAVLKEYKNGKASIDSKATANQEWWRLRHWNIEDKASNEGTQAGQDVGSAWAVNSIINKHADIMDSYPKPNILPREADDVEEANRLSKILPVLEVQSHGEDVYSQAGYDFLLDGTAITTVLWDSSLHDGMGDIVKRNVDIHNVFWQPGVEDIQDSEFFFHVAVKDVKDAKLMFPAFADVIGPDNRGTVDNYFHDDYIKGDNTVEVINCYYKRAEDRSIAIDLGNGDTETVTQTKTILHLAIIVSGHCVFCSEGMPEYANGYYIHGKYPYVVRRCFPIKDSPCGFSYLDIMKNPQRDVDILDQAIKHNAELKASPRFWVKDTANFNLEDFADWSKTFIKVGTGNITDNIVQVPVDNIPPFVINHMSQKIDEIKETSGNRDFSQGSTASGVTAASAIAALQEAGSKLSRDINKAMYRGSREEYELEIELIRQFYGEDRQFRIITDNGQADFVSYNNSNIVERDVVMPDGTVRHSRPIFDVSITAEKSNPFSRASQNETMKELYGLGLFAPNNAQAALVCLEGMDIEGIDKIKEMVMQNSIFHNQFNQMAQLIVSTMPQMAAQIGLISPEEAVMQAQAPIDTNGDNTRTNDNGVREHALTAKAREKARSAAEV